MRCGLDIRDLGGELSYRRLSVFLAGSLRDSCYMRSVSGEEAEWSLTDYLLALIADQLATANWQRSGDPKIPRPKPIPRPGVEMPDDGTKHYGSTVISLEDARVRWPLNGGD